MVIDDDNVDIVNNRFVMDFHFFLSVLRRGDVLSFVAWVVIPRLEPKAKIR